MKRKYPLEGIKVANFSWTGVGPMCIRYLAHWGATVVRVENHTRLDMPRVFLPFKDGIPGINRSAMFANVNTSVLGVTINLNKQAGLDIAWKLIKWADVMAESFTPGTMAKWGLDYESVSKVRPDIIYFSTTQNGQTGPMSRVAGFGIHAQALAGFPYVCGWPDRGPAPTQGAYTDYIAPRFGAVSILGALEYRRRTGEGQYIDQAQFEAGVQFLAPQIMDYRVNGRITGRNGNRLPNAAPHGAYPCKGDDRWCAIAVFSDDEWLRFRLALGSPAWARDSRFGTFAGRKEHEDELDHLVGERTSGYTAEEVETLMQTVGVAASVVQTSQDLYEDAHLAQQGYFRNLKHSEMGYIPYQGPQFALSDSPDHQFASPCIGEHNDHVFKEILGMSDGQVARALAEGGITTNADLPEIKAAY
ncbi:MAG: CoA transferase [Dehalococcoidia bacterium]|nr:CoA transferase [Dehalococcoidia bacterium]